MKTQENARKRKSVRKCTKTYISVSFDDLTIVYIFLRFCTDFNAGLYTFITIRKFSTCLINFFCRNSKRRKLYKNVETR